MIVPVPLEMLLGAILVGFLLLLGAFNAGREAGRSDVIDHGWHRRQEEPCNDD